MCLSDQNQNYEDWGRLEGEKHKNQEHKNEQNNGHFMRDCTLRFLSFSDINGSSPSLCGGANLPVIEYTQWTNTRCATFSISSLHRYAYGPIQWWGRWVTYAYTFICTLISCSYQSCMDCILIYFYASPLDYTYPFSTLYAHTDTCIGTNNTTRRLYQYNCCYQDTISPEQRHAR